MATAEAAAAASSARLAAAHTPVSASAAAAANSRIAFSQWDLLPSGNLSGQSNVYTINPDGTGRRQFTHVSATQAAGVPDWSATSAKIAYESNQTGDCRIWVMNCDGSGQRRLTSDPGFADLEPAWSPDGAQVWPTCSSPTGGGPASSATGPRAQAAEIKENRHETSNSPC